ncbi:DUF397 domain-containing protein [Streptomyces sp. CB02923]|uniref:DUF397 domain-containing protein n=1 Tax=Streptomyces sp. CB02923 TaxID=1718985 RepID=UPI00093F62C7|nr:DUF397 domain-containing protein [Streptomyces sp. CB02923]OKI09906.1 DUF397 domain-containing protein [Streptomyces sp. CB02923]
MTTESPRWFKSSYSENGGVCIEVATNLLTTHGMVPVRDSKVPNGPTLTLRPDAWTELVEFARQATV